MLRWFLAHVRLSADRIHIGSSFSVSLQRTLRVPETGEFPLPPGFGEFPIARIEDENTDLPEEWRGVPAFAVPMHQHEAMWLGFRGTPRSPKALKIAAGGINVLSGQAWQAGLHANPQDYIVVPDQPWLDGFNAGENYIRQFVAAPLGSGDTAEEQLSGTSIGGLQFELYQPDLEKIRARDRQRPVGPEISVSSSMGLAAGGRIRQKVYQDPYGMDAWHTRDTCRWVVHLLNVEQFRQRAGREPGPSPISAQSYADAGLPWFDLYDESAVSIPASKALSELKGVTPEEGESPETSWSPTKLPVKRLRVRTQSGRKKEHPNG